MKDAGYRVVTKALNESTVYEVGHGNKGEYVLVLSKYDASGLKKQFGGKTSQQTLPTGKRNYLWTTTDKEAFEKAKDYLNK